MQAILIEMTKMRAMHHTIDAVNKWNEIFSQLSDTSVRRTYNGSKFQMTKWHEAELLQFYETTKKDFKTKRL